MIDDILVGIFGEALFGRIGHSRRAQLIVRLFFGLLGAGLGITGAIVFARKDNLTANIAMHASMVAVFLFLACFSLFNIALARRWRWPGRLFIFSFVSLFLTRIVFGR